MQDPPKVAILRCEKLTSLAEVSKAIGHSSREREVLNADPDVRNPNLVAGTFEDFKAKLPEKVRKNAVYGIDVLMTTSPDFFGPTDGRDEKKVEEWKTRAMTWLREEFGASNIVRADLHLDEKTPHIQAIVMPLKDGKLNAKHWLDGRQKLSAMQDRHHAAMNGLWLRRGTRGSKAKHSEVKQFYASMKKSSELPEVEHKKTFGIKTIEDAESYLERAKPAIDALKAKARFSTVLVKQVTELKATIRSLELALDKALHPEKYLSRNRTRSPERDKDKERGGR